MMFFFFFQAEDGIRDVAVTGVQTCALPISGGVAVVVGRVAGAGRRGVDRRPQRPGGEAVLVGLEIGRASCRERVEISVVAVSLKKKNVKEEKRTETECGARARCVVAVSE